MYQHYPYPMRQLDGFLMSTCLLNLHSLRGTQHSITVEYPPAWLKKFTLFPFNPISTFNCSARDNLPLEK